MKKMWVGIVLCTEYHGYDDGFTTTAACGIFGSKAEADTACAKFISRTASDWSERQNADVEVDSTYASVCVDGMLKESVSASVYETTTGEMTEVW